MSALYTAILTLVINIPFGYWRESVEKFSFKWFVAVHAAVPVVIAIRQWAGVEWHFLVFIFLLVAYFTGQFAGARLYKKLHTPRGPTDRHSV